MDKLTILERKIKRAMKAQKQAEELLENKSRELYLANQDLQNINQKLSDANQEIIRQQEELIIKEKLSSLGMLAAGLAHEINNPLGFIISNIDTVNDYLVSIERVLSFAKNIEIKQENNSFNLFKTAYIDEDMDYIIKDISEVILPVKEGLHRISEIIKNIRSYSRVDVDASNNLQQTDINNIIETTLKTINTKQYNCEIKVITNKLPLIKANSCEITQVFTNILINALQALDKKQSCIIIKTEVKNGNIIVTVKDNGVGISDEDKNKIFNPFFTTKNNNVNTGLGLAISSKIMRDHNGKIEIDSVFGEGTEFRLIFTISNNINGLDNETVKRSMC